jgi:hypothetical protein
MRIIAPTVTATPERNAFVTWMLMLRTPLSIRVAFDR